MHDSPEHNRDKWDICAAILKLADVAQQALDLLKGNLATKYDLRESEARIIKAIGKELSKQDQQTLDNLLAHSKTETEKMDALVSSNKKTKE